MKNSESFHSESSHSSKGNSLFARMERLFLRYFIFLVKNHHQGDPIFLRARIPYRLKSVIVNFITRACFQNLSAQKFTLLYLDNATLIKKARLPNFGEGKFVASMERYFAEIDPGPVPLLHAAFRDDPPLSREVGECWMTLGRRFVSTTPFLLRFESVRSHSEIR